MSTAQATIVKERPIIFSAVMVNAIRQGHKTMTRRTINPQPHYSEAHKSWMWRSGRGTYDMNQRREVVTDTRTGKSTSREYSVPVETWLAESRRCPFKVGTRLWVKETLKVDAEGDITYAADGAELIPPPGKYDLRPGTVSSIHMPRWASRITLEITGVRVERVQDITPEDAKAEGWDEATAGQHPYGWYRDLWDQINGKGSWKTNPFVWVVAFKVLAPAVGGGGGREGR